jgi:hypothetical protein
VREAAGVRVLLRHTQPQDEVVALASSVERSKQVHERAGATQQLEPLGGIVHSRPLRPAHRTRKPILKSCT